MHMSQTATEPTSPRASSYAWLVICIASLFFFYELVQMSMFNAISNQLMTAFNVTAQHLGWISSGYFYANILFMFPAGLILDRFSTRKVILGSMLICIVGTFLFSTATNIYIATFARFLTGIGGSFPLLSCMRLASRWIPYRRLALASGLIVTIGMLGGYAAQRPLAELAEIVYWRLALRIDAVLGLVIMGLILIIVRDQPFSSKHNHQNKPAALPLQETIKLAVSNLQNWLYGLYTSLMNLPVFLLGQTFGSLYLQQARGLTLDEAVTTTSMIFIGLIIGSPTLGYITDHVGKRKPTMLICAALATLNILAIMLIPNLSWFSLSLLFLTLGFITSAQVLSYPAIASCNPNTIVASALGFASILIMAGGAFGEPLAGLLLDLHWSQTMHGNIPQYSNHDFLLGFAMMPIAFLLSFVISLLSKDKRH